MLILEAHQIKKYFGDRLIIGFDQLKVYSGDKIGIVGPNGSGKTTLLNIISGEVEPDEGSVRRYCDIAYIRQLSDELIEAEEKILKELKLSGKAGQEAFSGGEKTRVKIANAFSRGNGLILADEPTSNLDQQGIEILRQKLGAVDSFLLVSHDRCLLDRLCSKIIEIRDGKLSFYSGNYSFYKAQRDMEDEQGWREYENYLAEKSKLQDAVKDRQDKSRSIRKAPKRMGNSEARLHRRQANKKQKKINNAVNSLKTRLERLDKKDKPKELPQIRSDFSLTCPPENKIVISADKLTFSYGSRRIFDSTGFKIYNAAKTALWGENGAGKTTLLNLIAHNPNPQINIAPKAKIGYFCQGFENLDNNKSILENVMEDSVQTETAARTILARLLIPGDHVYKKVDLLSGGERIKVSFAKLFVSGANVLLLDEPTNYLDLLSIEALEKVLRDYEGTVLFVSHDRTFVNGVAERLLLIEKQKIIEFDGRLETFEKRRADADSGLLNQTEKIALQMKIAELVSRLSQPDTDREKLEVEYQDLIRQLKT